MSLHKIQNIGEREEVFIAKTKERYGQHGLSLHPKYNDADDFITNVWNDKEVCQYDKVSDKYKKWYHFLVILTVLINFVDLNKN